MGYSGGFESGLGSAEGGTEAQTASARTVVQMSQKYSIFI